MLASIRVYRGPVIITALMVVALVFWAWNSWQDINEAFQERRRHHAAAVLESSKAVIQTWGHPAERPQGRVEIVLTSIVRNSGARFLVLETGDRRIIAIGDVPTTLAPPTPEGEEMTPDGFVLWRQIKLPGQDQLPTAPAGEASLPGPGSRIILGLDTLVESKGYPRAVAGLIIVSLTTFLFVAASLVAWVMAIRGRLLAEQLEAERARRAHLEELGLAAAGLAHETKNPLGLIFGLAQRIAADPGIPDKSRIMIEQIMDEVDKASARLGNFMTFARQREVKSRVLDGMAVLNQVLGILAPDFAAAGVNLEVAAAPLPVRADEEMLQQIVINLLLNSLHASPRGSRTLVRLEREGSGAALVVEDQGSGIPADLLPKVFKPYVAGRPDGHGLGLAIVLRLVEVQGWRIGIESQPGVGTVATISGLQLSEEGEGGHESHDTGGR